MAQDTAPQSNVSSQDVSNANALNQGVSEVRQALSDNSDAVVAQINAITTAVTNSIIGGSTGSTDNRILVSKGTGGRALEASVATLDPATGIISATAIWQGTVIAPNFGGTGVANNVANTLTWVGAFASIFRLSAATDVTFPTSGTLATTANAIGSIAVQVFTSAGANTYTPTSGMKQCLAISTGAGGGGGGADSDGSSAGNGAGGGAGATCWELFSAATIGASQTVTIGTAGTAGSTAGGNGGNGGDTTFGALHTAGGGVGGQGVVGTNWPEITKGGAGGAASNGLINIGGGAGVNALGVANGAIVASMAGAGGSSFWGGGGAGGIVISVASGTDVGGDGVAYGAGGGGGANVSTAAGIAGGAGAGGICVVIEFV